MQFRGKLYKAIHDAQFINSIIFYKMDDKINKQKFKKLSIQSMRKLDSPREWEEMDNLQGNDQFDELKSQSSKLNGDPKQKRSNKVQRKFRRFTQIECYQQALVELRRQNQKYFKPFEKHKLSISIMTAIKMLQDALKTDKDFVKTLRQMGCKTRMRIRNKKAATQLFQVMLTYLQESILPAWMKEGHTSLLNKSDQQFDDQFLKMQQKY